VVRYAFPVRLFHSLLHAGSSRRIQVGNLRRVGNPPESLVDRPTSAG
jgi:hypothetical protein